MGKLIVHLFCVFFMCLVLLLLSSTTRGEAPSQNFMDVMKHDEKVCSMSKFLYNSSLAKYCTGIDYPKEELQMRLENMNTFTCLVVYDTSYKLCNYSSHGQNRINSTAAFNAYIDKSVADANNIDKKAFCMSVKGITPMYEKTKQLVAPLMSYINDDEKCSTLCFFSSQLDPLCAMLAWTKSIDDEVQKITVLNTGTSSHVQTGKKIESDIHQMDQSKINSDPAEGIPLTFDTEVKPDTNNAPDVNKEVEEKNDDINQHEQAVPDKPVAADPQTVNTKNIQEEELPKTKESGTVTNSADAPAPAAIADIPSVPNPKKEAVKTEITDQELKTNNGNANGPSNSASNVSNKGSVPSSNEDIKTSTISDNTQDGVDVAAAREWQTDRLDNDPYDPDDVEQPVDTNDQSQNIPEPSEQRDISHRYHSIQPEEESHFFTYFTVVSLVCIAGYIGYHNKQKILAIVVEGRRSRNSRGRRRPSTASYRKLDCTLEEAVTSQCNANVTHVIY